MPPMRLRPARVGRTSMPGMREGVRSKRCIQRRDRPDLRPNRSGSRSTWGFLPVLGSAANDPSIFAGAVVSDISRCNRNWWRSSVDRLRNVDAPPMGCPSFEFVDWSHLGLCCRGHRRLGLVRRHPGHVNYGAMTCPLPHVQIERVCRLVSHGARKSRFCTP